MQLDAVSMNFYSLVINVQSFMIKYTHFFLEIMKVENRRIGEIVWKHCEVFDIK